MRVVESSKRHWYGETESCRMLRIETEFVGGREGCLWIDRDRWRQRRLMSEKIGVWVTIVGGQGQEDKFNDRGRGQHSLKTGTER